MEPFLRLGLLAVQDDGDGQDVDEQTPGAMSICDDDGDESDEYDDCGSDYGGDDSDGDSGDDDGSDEEEQEVPPRVELQLEAQRHLHRDTSSSGTDEVRNVQKGKLCQKYSFQEY